MRAETGPRGISIFPQGFIDLEDGLDVQLNERMVAPCLVTRSTQQ